MAIFESDLVCRLTVATGPGDANAQPDPNASLGSFLSTTDADLTTVLNNLYDDITQAESESGQTVYRCIAFLNVNATETWEAVRSFLESEIALGADIEIGLDTNPVVARNSASQQFISVANESTAPSGVTFSAPTTQPTGLLHGDIGPNQCHALWLKRVKGAGTAGVNPDGVTVRPEGLN